MYGSYGLEPGMKRYNHSCEEYDSLNSPADDPFVRICPLGVKSCFYITGKYGDQSNTFVKILTTRCPKKKWDLLLVIVAVNPTFFLGHLVDTLNNNPT